MAIMHRKLPRLEAALMVLRRRGIRAETMLDLGCSDGVLTIEVARAVQARDVYGIDTDEEALREASARSIKDFNIAI